MGKEQPKKRPKKFSYRRGLMSAKKYREIEKKFADGNETPEQYFASHDITPIEGAGRYRLLLDQCVNPYTAYFFERAGFDVRSVRSIFEGAPNEKVFDYVVKTGRVLITHNSDFADTGRFNAASSEGIIFFPVPQEGNRNVNMTPRLLLILRRFMKRLHANMQQARGKVVHCNIYGEVKSLPLPVWKVQQRLNGKGSSAGLSP